MTNDKVTEADAIATIVADRCHGKRKPGQAAQRYAIIYQAARLGALEAMQSASPRPTGDVVDGDSTAAVAIAISRALSDQGIELSPQVALYAATEAEAALATLQPADPVEPKVSSDVKGRYHVEGQTSTKGPRWQIWDGERHLARFQNLADEGDAVAICRELNETAAAIVTLRASDPSRELVEAWQPIETAPKDGSELLLATSGWVRIGSWTSGRYLGRSKGYEPAWGSGSSYGWEPTHWMPVQPSPPTTTDEVTK